MCIRDRLCKFQNVFSDKPGKTTLVSHDVKLMEGVRPMRQSPYPLHPERLKLVNKEIEELLQEGIIEESESPWAAPIVLVPKPDGTLSCLLYTSDAADERSSVDLG